MAIIRVRSINPFHREDFLSRVFQEMQDGGMKPGEFPLGRSLSWKGFRIAATEADLAAICVNALDFREPHMRPDRKLFTAFRISLGAHLLERGLSFTKAQRRVLAESVVMQLKAGNDAFPVEAIRRVLKAQRQTAAETA